MTFSTLISTIELAARAGEPALRIVDCRFDLIDVESGCRAYRASHIPGAVYARLDNDLSGRKTGTNGRHPLPDPDVLRNTFSRLGIAREVQVVAYDQDMGMYASRLWWLLRWMGHESVAVLDGGFAKWIAEGRPTSSGDEAHSPREFIGTPHGDMVVGADDIPGSPGVLLDARSPERYRGDVEPLDRVAGHIPGARNHYYTLNLGSDGTFRPPTKLGHVLRDVIGGVPTNQVACYCGSGVTACHNLLALEHAGLHGAKLYPGSWSEWSSDPARPVERGG